MTTIVSPCCHRNVIADLHPSGAAWYQISKLDICSCCGREVTKYEYACDICGEVGCDETCENDDLSGVVQAVDLSNQQADIF